MIFYDTETLGLSGPVVLIQWAEDDGEVHLFNVWKHRISETLDLIDYMMNHEGGIVGDGYLKKKRGPLSGDEVFAVLQKGEGVLSRAAMNNIGEKTFASLLAGNVGKIGGAVPAKMPINSPASVGAMAANISATVNENKQTTIYVDTFIGEKEWFNKLADEYDIKVAGKKAKNTGSTRRVISSYNENNRGRY
jgi:hypothetical protein